MVQLKSPAAFVLTVVFNSFNSCMVQLKCFLGTEKGWFGKGFNSCMVQLKSVGELTHDSNGTEF